VTSVWGLGAVAGAVAALGQLGWRPSSPRRAFLWWKKNVWTFGRWLGLQQVLYSGASFATVAALAGILGARDYGGLRAVQAILAPLSLLGPAIALPGLPIVARTVAASSRRALKISAQFAGLITLATSAYVVLLYALPGVLSLFFGQGFLRFRSIIVPIGIGQILAAPAFGLNLFLMAEQRGRILLFLATLNAALYLTFAVGLGSVYGLGGAAWAYAGSSAIGESALLVVLRSRARRDTTS
jgi:O-antigen/teichoic acid export membrane protein